MAWMHALDSNKFVLIDQNMYNKRREAGQAQPVKQTCDANESLIDTGMQREKNAMRRNFYKDSHGDARRIRIEIEIRVREARRHWEGMGGRLLGSEWGRV